MKDAKSALGSLLNLVSLPRRNKPQVGSTPADVVHAENKWKLLRYRARPEGLAFSTPILMVPSLINRHYVLDLMPGKSLAEFLVSRGHDLYCIDWGTPGDEDRYVTFDDVVDRILGRAVRVACRTSDSDAVHLFGYCLGGTLTAIHAALHGERVRSLLALAAPVAFEHAGVMGRWTRSPQFEPGLVTQAMGNVPWQLLQASFQMLRPTLSLSKAVHLIDRAWDDEYLDGFLALETWGNDNVAFPGEAYRQYLEELYRGDKLVRDALYVSGRQVKLSAITCPTLAITFLHDNIVPVEAAEPLVTRVSSDDPANQDRELWKLPGGHVGAVVSRAAAKGLWPKLSAWWAVRD